MRRVLAVSFMLAGAALHTPGMAQTPAADSGWREIASVLRHPRCMNCHTVTEFPRQGDERRRHHQLVMRGDQGTGAPTLQCAACHQTGNVAEGRVPGAPNWHLAPLSMGWEGLDDPALCAALKDMRKNHGMDLAKLEKHMTEDKLVQWAWTPGARAAPTVSQSAFHAAVKRWVAAQAPCP